MQVGVEKFSGRRLKQALDYSLITAKSLADAVDVSASNITKYIGGDLKPSPNVFDRIRIYLKFPPQFFLDDGDQEIAKDGLKQWRSLKAATKRARKRGEVLLEWQIESYSYFKNYFNYPTYQKKMVSSPIDHRAINSDFIEQLTVDLRESWGVGLQPIKNLTRQVECDGVCVSHADLGNDKLDAVSCVRAGVPYILINSQIASSSRFRFNVAHELAHILIHSTVTEKQLEDEGLYDELEEQAHYFAAALLLPAEAFANDFWAPTLKCLEGLKLKWNVSIQAMMRRALDLNLITSAQFGYLNIAINRKGWRSKEPLDDTTPIERPRLFGQSLERMESDHGKSPKEIINDLPFPPWVAGQLWSVNATVFSLPTEESDAVVLKFPKRIS